MLFWGTVREQNGTYIVNNHLLLHEHKLQINHATYKAWLKKQTNKTNKQKKNNPTLL